MKDKNKGVQMDIGNGGKVQLSRRGESEDDYHIRYGKAHLKSGKADNEYKKLFLNKIDSIGRKKDLEDVKEHLQPYWGNGKGNPNGDTK